MQEIALSIETHHLATCAEARVKSQYAFLTERSRHQQLFEIAYEDADSLLVGFLLAQLGIFGLDRRLEQSLEAVGYSIGHEVAGLSAATHK